MNKEEKKIDIQIDIPDDIAQGAYCNLAAISHSETEFVIDSIFLQPQQPRGKVRSRVIVSPQNAKRILLALQDNISKYEQKFGIIPASKEPPQGFGLKLSNN